LPTSVAKTHHNHTTLGYAEDGGLYVPERIPHLTAEQMRAWKKLNYPSLVGQVLRLFVSDSELTDADIAGTTMSRYKLKVF